MFVSYEQGSKQFKVFIYYCFNSFHDHDLLQNVLQYINIINILTTSVIGFKFVIFNGHNNINNFLRNKILIIVETNQGALKHHYIIINKNLHGAA